MTTERVPIRLDRIALESFVEDYEGGYPENLKLINIRGTNGSGKSTIPLSYLAKDRGAFIFTWKGKERATCFPSYGVVAMGKYRTKTGGLDGFKNNAETREVLETLWRTPFTILMEGIIASTIFSTYLNLFKELENVEPKRSIGIMNLLPPQEVVLERVQIRNGGKKVDEKSILSKWRTVNKNAQKFKDEGLNSWISDNSEIEKDDTFDWFLDEIEKNMGEI